MATGSGGFCTDCGRPVPRSATYCGYCGAEIVHGEEATCQSCDSPASASARYCYKCGSRIRSNSPPESTGTLR